MRPDVSMRLTVSAIHCAANIQGCGSSLAKRKVAGTWHTFRPMRWEMALLKHELGGPGATEGDEETAHVRKQLQMLVEEEIKPPEGKRVYVRVQYCIGK